MRLSVLQFAALLFAIIHAMTLTSKSDAGEDLSGTLFTMFLFTVSFIFVLAYIIGGPRFVDLDNTFSENE